MRLALRRCEWSGVVAASVAFLLTACSSGVSGSHPVAPAAAAPASSASDTGVGTGAAVGQSSGTDLGSSASCSDYDSATTGTRMTTVLSALRSRGMPTDYATTVSWELSVFAACRTQFGSSGQTPYDYTDPQKYIPDIGDPAAGALQPR
jgi:hypothetical protein